ncbi:hypothetical protein COB55_04565 [Candidatus Wolfebacteria bacterium]|nr:MAG: hypothetical protein COB55_04565 [Candidatus Wolfebacteria bacterium]
MKTKKIVASLNNSRIRLEELMASPISNLSDIEIGEMNTLSSNGDNISLSLEDETLVEKIRNSNLAQRIIRGEVVERYPLTKKDLHQLDELANRENNSVN